MKTIFLCILSIASSLAMVSQNVYYVSTSGNDSNDGSTISTAWRTITYAASSASSVSPGDTVFIKAGDYGNEYVVFETSGTSSNQITFEGYRSTPGDHPDLQWIYGDLLDASVMPLLDGGDRTKGTAITLKNREHIIVKNLQIRNYRDGIYAKNGHHLKIDNINTMNFGDINENYHGKGIVFGSHASNNTIENCSVLNACAEGIAIKGDNQTLRNCRIYSDDNTTGSKSAMDYYIHVEGNNNVIEECYTERIGELGHLGHGIGLKGNCENNLIINCISKGMGSDGYQLRHRGVKNNIIKNSLAINCGFVIRDGASHNSIKNCKSIDAKNSVYFTDTSEDEGAQNSGNHNVFENCIFQNPSEAQISFFYYDQVSPAKNNTFMNCVFNGGKYLFTCDRENNGNKMINSIIINVENLYRTEYKQNTRYPLNFDFEYSNFYNNWFDTPIGSNITTHDPNFVSICNNDYRLKASSLCIDAGVLQGAPSTDFNGTKRPLGNGVDIGAFEYNHLP